MKEKINLDLKTIKYVYEKYKAYIYPFVIIVLSIFLLFQFVVPQFRSLILAQEQAREASEKLEILKSNLQILTNIDEESLNSDFQILIKALPISKDFSGILNSIYFAAQKSGVSLGAFSLQLKESKTEKDAQFPKININVPVISNVDGVNSFVETITKSVPLVEVTQIKVSERNSVVNLAFYYKPLNERKQDQATPISQKGVTLINQLKTFENVSASVPTIPIGTSSGEINP